MKQLTTLVFLLVSSAIAFAQPWPVYQAGTTYNSSQHSGSCGRMVSEDADGFVHVVWMNAQDNGLATRHVYYNAWDPSTYVFTLGAGVQIDPGSRAGYVTQATLPGGFCFPAFHGVFPGDMFSHAAAAIDFLPRAGAFTSFYPAWIYEGGQPLPIEFPKIAVSPDSTFHMASMELFMGEPYYGRIYYSRGRPLFDAGGFGMNITWQVVDGANHQFMLLDTSTVIAHDIASSQSENRVAVAYIRSITAYADTVSLNDMDVFLRVSEDAGVNWTPPTNITSFIQPDDQCFNGTGDWSCCNRDTLRPYFDLSILLDDQDNIHVAFSSVRFRHWVDGEVADEETAQAAQIWQWSENSNGFSLVAEKWQPGVTHTLPNTNAMVARPSLSQDTVSGYLYCSYLQYDSTQYSTYDRMNADAFVSVSTDNGAHWSVGVNVTNTPPEIVPGGPGQNQSEQDATLPVFSSDSLNLFYEIDHDAGAGDMPAIKEMKLRRVPVAAIPASPLMPEAQMHVADVPCGESADENSEALPGAFSLGAYPNPFNNSTTVRFDLPHAADIRINAYDLLGRFAAPIFNGRGEAGSHSVNWNAELLPSGIYFVVLESGETRIPHKVMLLK